MRVARKLHRGHKHDSSLLAGLREAAKLFSQSNDAVRVIWTEKWEEPDADTHTQPSEDHGNGGRAGPVFILDSSFNPPTRAHLHLASLAFRHTSTRPAPGTGAVTTGRTGPGRTGLGRTGPGSDCTRLLLLLSVWNADKRLAPATMDHRLSMMARFAETDVVDAWRAQVQSRRQTGETVGMYKGREENRPAEKEDEDGRGERREIGDREVNREADREADRGGEEEREETEEREKNEETDGQRQLQTSACTLKPTARELQIDIGLINAPYFVDKSSTITQYDSTSSDPGCGPAMRYHNHRDHDPPDHRDHNPPDHRGQYHHVHLVGADTLERIFAARYYPPFHPPLSALTPFFDAGHRLIVLQRSLNRAEAKDSGSLILQGLRNGSLDPQGADANWAAQLDLIPADPRIASVSSTCIRDAVAKNEWEAVERLCTGSVTAWIREHHLYRDGNS